MIRAGHGSSPRQILEPIPISDVPPCLALLLSQLLWRLLLQLLLRQCCLRAQIGCFCAARADTAARAPPCLSRLPGLFVYGLCCAAPAPAIALCSLIQVAGRTKSALRCQSASDKTRGDGEHNHRSAKATPYAPFAASTWYFVAASCTRSTRVNARSRADAAMRIPVTAAAAIPSRARGPAPRGLLLSMLWALHDGTRCQGERGRGHYRPGSSGWILLR